ncbi:MAG: copper-binding protein [Maricaulaceae bacterium]|nr:copper-binding protein [Maricaulaceae bacterium]
MRKLALILTAPALAFAAPALADHPSGHQHHHHHSAQGQQSTALADIREANAETREVLLRHEPMDEIGWPAMVMTLPVADDVDFDLFQPGAELMITVRVDNGEGVIIAAEPADGAEDHSHHH